MLIRTDIHYYHACSANLAFTNQIIFVRCRINTNIIEPQSPEQNPIRYLILE